MPEPHNLVPDVDRTAIKMADASLDLGGTRTHISGDERFADAEVFVRSVATVRPRDMIYLTSAHRSILYSSLRLGDPMLAPAVGLDRVDSLLRNVDAYRAAWFQDVERTEYAA